MINNTNKKIKVAVALSGGVDSAVAAALLVKQGYEVTGIHLHLWSEDQKSKIKDQIFQNKCCNTESLEAARKTAFQLGIPFHVLNFEDIFKKTVVKSFLGEYGKGMTPNPCVICNKKIKFGALLEYVRAMGFEYLATGHYCRIAAEAQSSKCKVQSENLKFKVKDKELKEDSECGRNTGFTRIAKGVIYHLLTGVDQTKDQSYFLYNLKQEQLKHLLFPLGGYVKTEVRRMAEKYNLPSAKRPESQEICFFAESDYRPFLERNIAGKIRPGEVVDTGGNIIGKHSGLPLYTIGQRHGFRLEGELKIKNEKFKIKERNLRIIPPFYVIKKDVRKNQLVVGFGKETEVKEFGVKRVNWIQSNEKLIMNNEKIGLYVRIRHGGALLKCKVKSDRQKVISKKKDQNLSLLTYHVSLSEPQRGISPGQSAVIYKKFKIKNEKLKISRTEDMEVLGGGIIC